ncbi:MAG: lipopolysaccharide transport periplasmic protein LptA [Deltaproteobacteria bacterium]|nr:lipopolysaccharide transport periplasmic protein LptA [Deltaproteobacteria bacterium]
MRGLRYITPLIAFWLLPQLVFAQGSGEFRGGEGPIHITSQRLEADHKGNLITFVGDVVARQKEFVLYSERLLLFLDKEGNEIEKIVAQGNVRIVQGKRRGTCQEATYYHRERKVILQGDPVLREGDNWVRGQRIIYYIDEQKSVAEGKGRERVTVTIIPGEEKR